MMSSFSIKRKKTPFQKHKEEEEAKKRREEDETARLYAEFVESFQDDTAPGSKTFVRGDMDLILYSNTNDKLKIGSEGGNSKDGVSGSKKGSRYVPSFVPPPMATQDKDYEKKKDEMVKVKVKEKEKGKSRNIDLLMDELNPLYFAICASGDTLQRWRTDPFIMITGRARWIPPSVPVAKSPEHVESGSTFAAGRSRYIELEGKQRSEPERTLTDAQRDDYEDLLRALTLERSQIMEATGFAMDNADAAGEIVEVLTESLTLKETPIPTKVARLMLVSDILHNSSVPVKNASAYRTKFELALPDIVESFNDLYHSIKVSSGETSDAIKNYQDAALAMGKGAATKELLNLPLGELERRCRQNGLSLVGGRETMVARLLYLEEAEKQRGYEQNDDLKYAQTRLNSVRYLGGQKERNTEMESTGLSALTSNREDETQLQGKGFGLLAPTITITQPESRAFTDTEKNEPMLTASKWERDDSESDDELKTNTMDHELTYSFSGNENACVIPKCVEMDLATDASVPVHPDSGINEEQRQKLRQVEVALIEYRDSLEDRGVKDVGEIEKKVAFHRKHLESELVVHSNKITLINKRRTSDRRERRDESHESSRKRNHSPSEIKIPQRKSSSRDRGRENEGNGDTGDTERHSDKANELERERKRDREKSASRDKGRGRG